MTDAADRRDQRNAARKVQLGVFALAKELGIDIRSPSPLEGSLVLDDHSKAAVRRLAQRAEHAGVSAFHTILSGDVDRVEDLYAPSYRAGMGKSLAASTVESQVTVLTAARSTVCLIGVLTMFTGPAGVQAVRTAGQGTAVSE